MSIGVDRTLRRLSTAVQRRPEDAQADVIAEIEARVDDFLRPQMTDGQSAIVTMRLARPRDYASSAEVDGMLQRPKHRNAVFRG